MMSNIKITGALLKPDGSVFCSITRDGVHELFHAVRDRDHVPDNKVIVELLSGVFVDTWTVAKQRAMVTATHPDIVFSFDEDKAQARRSLKDKVDAARKKITRDPVRYKVAHAAKNGDTIAQDKLNAEAVHRAMTWQVLADEIIADEHDEERLSFVISGISSAGIAAIDGTISVAAVQAALDAHLLKLVDALK
jgi:hypothetical protein